MTDEDDEMTRESSRLLTENLVSTEGNRNVSVSTIFQRQTELLTYAIYPVLYQLANSLHAKELISLETKDKIVNGKETDLQKARELVITLQTEIKGRENPYNYVNKLCNTFKDFGNKAIHDIANTILKEIDADDCERVVIPRQCSKRCCFVTIFMLNIIFAILVFTAMAILVIELGLPNQEYQQDITSDKITMTVGGGILISLKSEGFNMDEVEYVNITLISNKSNNPVTAYEGNCFKPTSKSLPPHILFVDDSSRHQAINYNSDINPLYVLPNSSLIYTITINSTSTNNGCIYLYLFTDLVNYFHFLTEQNEPSQQYYKSQCIPEKSPKNSHHIVEFLMNETTFVYVGMELNNTILVQCNITAKLVSYDTQPMSDSYRLFYQQTKKVEFCRHYCLRVYGRKRCIIIESKELVTISYTTGFVNANTMKEFKVLAVVLIVVLALAAVVLGIFILGCLNKWYKELKIQHM